MVETKVRKKAIHRLARSTRAGLSSNDPGGDPALNKALRLTEKLLAELEALSVGTQQEAACSTKATTPAETNDSFDLQTRTSLVKLLIQQRQARIRFFPNEIFHEPAWDILLALYLSWYDGETPFVKALVAMSPAPVTTSQRWIRHMTDLGLLTRVTDGRDRRRVKVSLSENGLEAMNLYLADFLRG